jgi:putative ABC transport system permease protein
MKMLTKFKSLLRNLTRKRQRDEELDAEVRGYVEMLAEDKMRKGMKPDEARRAAQIELGGVEQVKERVREVRAGAWLDSLLQDARYGTRMLRKSPGFTAVAVLTLALGIGANTAIFSVVSSVVLEPLPFKDSERVIVIWWGAAARDLPNGTASLDVAADYEPGNLNLTGSGPAQRIPAAEVSESFFRVFSLDPTRGRMFSALDEKPGHAPVVILSHELWQTRYRSDPNILSRTVYLNGKGFTPVGVLPERFDFPTKAQAWLPLPPSFDQDAFGGNAFMRFQIGRLRAGKSLSDARSEMEVIRRREADSADSATPARVQTLHEYLAGDTRPAVLMLFGAVGFVLLIACADVANLLLTRGAGRTREVAVRRTLGASRSRLIRQFLSESILLSLLGGGVGLLFGWWAIIPSRALIPSRGAFATDVSLDGRVLAFTFVLAIATGIIAGIVPALQSSTADLSEGLREGARSSAEGFRVGSHRRMRSLLGISEIALALILVIGATLCLRSLGRLLDVNPGFQTDNVLAARLSLLGPKYQQMTQRTLFLQEVLARTRAIPGVQAVAVVNYAPLDMSAIFMGMNIQAVDSKKAFPPTPFGALYMTASPDYFRLMRIPQLEGRIFNEGDASGTKPVAIISESIAKNLWPDRNPLGGHFSLDGAIRSDPPIEVVGVVGDVRYFGLSAEPMAAMYFPARQAPPNDVSLLVRTDHDPLALAGTVRQAIRDVDPDEPVASFSTEDQLLSKSVAQPRFRSLLLAIFGGLALLLAGVGVYSVTSYTVAQRTHEIGIRMALGAERRDILTIVAQYGMRLAVIGLGFGLVGAYLLARLASSFLYGIRPTDPSAFLLGSATLAVIVFLASYIPARRAMRVDPMVALRHD